MAEGFKYSSGSNKEWLTIEELRNIITESGCEN